MDGYLKLHEMLGTALKQAGEESGMLLGQELDISLIDSITTSRHSYFGVLDDSCFVMGVDSREAYRGQFYLIFNLRDAIVLSSILLGIPPARIQEKKRLAIIESDGEDAFSEIANMINGSFNTVFQGSLPNKVHLKLLPAKKFTPDVDQLTDDEPLPDGNFLMFRSKLEMPDQELNYVDVLIPVNLANLFDPPVEEQEDEAVPAPPGGGLVPEDAVDGEGPDSGEDKSDATGDEASVEAAASGQAGIDSIMVLEDDDKERKQMVEAVAFTGYRVVEGTLNADIKQLISGYNVRLVLIGSLDADDRELAVCIKVSAIRQDSPPPIIMSAVRWTRTAVLKALKYGARDIIIKPFSEEELAAKVRRFCTTASQ